LNAFALNGPRIQMLKFLMFLEVLELDFDRDSKLLNVSKSPFTRLRRFFSYKSLEEI